MRFARRASVTILLLAAVAEPAAAGRVLYATAARGNRVDVFPIERGTGAVSGRGAWVDTGGVEPRRLLVDDPANACTLWVAEADRVEAYRIRPDGSLRLIGRTKPIAGMDPRDIAVDPQGRYLYVPQTGPARIAAYALATSGEGRGAPEEDFANCIQGMRFNDYETIVAAGDRIFVTSMGISPRLETFDITATGELRGRSCPGQTVVECTCTDSDGDERCDVGVTETGCTPCDATAETNHGDGITCDPSRIASPAPFPCHPDPRMRNRDAKVTVVGADGSETPATAPYVCPSDFSRDACRNAGSDPSPVSCPTSLRHLGNGDRSFVVAGDQVLLGRIRGHRLSTVALVKEGDAATALAQPGELAPFVCKDRSATPPQYFYCLSDPDRIERARSTRVRRRSVCQQRSQQRTPTPRGYATIQFDPASRTLFGARFTDGRIDVFGLWQNATDPATSDGPSCRRAPLRSGDLKLPRGPAGETKENLRMSPFRVAADQGVLYVAGGLLDRVQAFAYRRGRHGAPSIDTRPFAETEELEDSFPNDVLVAVPAPSDADCPR